jgi:hypothetical protein
MRVIQVKYLGATNHRPSRWKAFTWGGLRAEAPYDYEKNQIGNARAAAEKLIADNYLHWKIGSEGMLPNGDYVFILGS